MGESEKIVFPVLRKDGHTLSVDYVALEDIEFFEFIDNRVWAFTPNGKFQMLHTITDYALLDGFAQTDRPFVVNQSRVVAFDPTWSQVLFKNKSRANVSGNLAKMLRSWLNHLPKV
ncbi:LytTR family DNA-binding domain-containing protein [Paenibacillus sp. VTT E-133291]|uniref:LytTR family DNA-binding domain-containing protein n=1 Tax=Paenibacillus sp. VTT E-133291 TaxID=1986223 RepID=UPI0015C65B8B|nr:LytTR family DNA-binding domain-containing protein [Paenibacillus sp. VTT E-133291]